VALRSTQRALIATVLIVCLAGLAAALYLHHLHQPLRSTAGGPPPDLLSQLPADAPVIAYIDVANARKSPNSPLAALLGLAAPQLETASQSRAKRAPQTRDNDAREYSQFVRDTGFDYTRDLDQAAVAFWPSNLSPAANRAGENPALAVADGRFDQQKIVAYAMHVGGKAETLGAHTRYIVPGYPTVAFEFRSASRIAIASGKNAADQLNLAVGPSTNSALEARVKRVAGAPIFGDARTDHLPGSFYADFRNSPQLEHLIRSIQEISLAGEPHGNTIHLALDAESDSMTHAIELSTLLDGFRLIGSMALSDPKTRAQLDMTREQAAVLEAFVRQAQVSHQDRWVRISLDLTPAMLGQAEKEGR
jgi:hypothetical protein